MLVIPSFESAACRLESITFLIAAACPCVADFGCSGHPKYLQALLAPKEEYISVLVWWKSRRLLRYPGHCKLLGSC